MENKINMLIKEKEKEKKEIEEKINILIKENKNFKNLFDKYKEILDNKIEQEKEEESCRNSCINEEFKENPENLKFTEYLTNIHSASGCLYNFDAFISIKDNTEHLVYNNKNNYDLEIMRIRDEKKVNSLKGHTCSTTVIRYYLKDNKEEYILSCDFNKIAIIWDIHNISVKKFMVQTKYAGNILDALLLFNIFNKNYILLSSDNKNEYSKLYEFKENTNFLKNIYGTNKIALVI